LSAFQSGSVSGDLGSLGVKYFGVGSNFVLDALEDADAAARLVAVAAEV